MNFSALLLVMVCTLPVVYSATFGSYTTSKMLGSQVTLWYKVDGEYVSFLLEKTAAGFVALGLGSGMASADIVTITKSGEGIILTDCKLNGYQPPICKESSQDWVFAKSASESSEYTDTSMKVEFKRKLAKSGVDDDKDFTMGDNSMIFSYTTSNTVVQHDATGAKGLVTITLSNGSINKNNSWGKIQFVGMVIMFSALVTLFVA